MHSSGLELLHLYSSSASTNLIDRFPSAKMKLSIAYPLLALTTGILAVPLDARDYLNVNLNVNDQGNQSYECLQMRLTCGLCP